MNSSASSSCNSPLDLVGYFLFQSPTCESSEASRLLKDCARRELNAFLWVSLIAITGLLVEKVFRLFSMGARAWAIPGPPCSSFFGHGSLGSRQDFIDFLSESHYKYGSIFKLWLGPTQLLVSVNDPALVKDLLLKAKDKLPFAGKAFRLAFGRSNLFFCSTDQAQRRRESLAFEFSKKLHERTTIISENVILSIIEAIDGIMEQGNIDCKVISQHMAFSIMGTKLFGDAFLDWSSASFYEELLMKIVKEAPYWASYRVTPFWKSGFWRCQCLSKKVKRLTQDIIQHCRKSYRLLCLMDQSFINGIEKVGTKAVSGGLPCSCVVLQDKFLSQEFNGPLSPGEEPCGNVMGVMSHGCSAMADLIGNIIERLVADCGLQDKIYSEITMVRQGSLKEDQNFCRMRLLLATIYETARLLPAGPLLQRCSLKYDLSLKNGAVIPAGAMIVVPVHLLQMDTSAWGSDAGKFNPYRFLSKGGEVSYLSQDSPITDIPSGAAGEAVASSYASYILMDPNDNAAFLPFGSGIRACVAQKFVIQGVASLFASLLERYKVRRRPPSKKDPSTTSSEMVFVTRSIGMN